MLGQGLHVDPLAPGTPPLDRREWGAGKREAMSSPEMERFRVALQPPDGGTPRAGVLGDLAARYDPTQDECLRRCLHWEELSVAEWTAGDRGTPDGIPDFYRSVTSWSYETDLADVSASLLDFARFRLERRGASARYIDLDRQGLEPGRYNVITALDTLVHVPDLEEAVRALHEALQPGGWLFANFDVRPQLGGANAWHLYDNDMQVRWIVQRQGFEPRADLDGITVCYQRVDPSGWRHLARGARDTFLLRNPARRYLRRIRVPRPIRAFRGRRTERTA